MKYLGDYAAGATVKFTFTTTQTDGTPITLAGTPYLRCYKGVGTTESSNISPTVDLDSRTGLHGVSIDLSGDTGFYTSGEDYSVVLTAGTVDGTSVVGYTVAHFSIGNRSNITLSDIEGSNYILKSTTSGKNEIDTDTISTLGGTAQTGDTYALLTTSDSELTTVPTTTGTIIQKIRFIFQYFRNRRTVTATAETLYKEDASTTLGTATLEDDSTTFTKGEMNT